MTTVQFLKMLCCYVVVVADDMEAQTHELKVKININNCNFFSRVFFSRSAHISSHPTKPLEIYFP